MKTQMFFVVAAFLAAVTMALGASIPNDANNLPPPANGPTNPQQVPEPVTTDNAPAVPDDLKADGFLWGGYGYGLGGYGLGGYGLGYGYRGNPWYGYRYRPSYYGGYYGYNGYW